MQRAARVPSQQPRACPDVGRIRPDASSCLDGASPEQQNRAAPLFHFLFSPFQALPFSFNSNRYIKTIRNRRNPKKTIITSQF
jgi:hypothetical protein